MSSALFLNRNPKNTMGDTGAFFIRDVQIIPSKNQFVRADQLVAVQPKVMRMLQYLAEHQDRVISTEELIEHLWDGRVVSYATVPRCITLLRKALGEFLNDEEIVANYSKKGYQLLIPPTSVLPQEKSVEESEDSIDETKPLSVNKSLVSGISLCLLVLCAGLFFGYSSLGGISIDKRHKTLFEQQSGYTNETGHERFAEPHPDNHHVLYVRDTFNPDNFARNHSTLVIRAEDGTEWDVDSTSGIWFKLAWAPDPTKLVAVEVKRNKGKPVTNNFYEVADFFYAIHIFELDLANKKMKNKTSLNQWQGRLLSITWWDDHTLELVARQGSKANNQRYRMDATTGALTEIDSPNTSLIPLASSVYNRMTAVTFEQDEEILVAIYDTDAHLLAKGEFNADIINISWIPDGSGVLLYSDYSELHVMYLDGQIEPIHLHRHRDRFTYRPRYSFDGQSMYISEKRYQSNLQRYQPDGDISAVTNNDAYNYLATFSSDGERILYVSVRNNQLQLWLIENDKEMLVHATNADKIRELVWVQNDEALIYKTTDEIILYDLNMRTTRTLLQDAKHILPLGWDEHNEILTVRKTRRDQANIWALNLKTKQETQLTHGSIGAAKMFNSTVYFQYVNKDGLWAVGRNQEPILLADNYPKNTKMLKVDNKDVFYVLGGRCRESDVFHFDLSAKETVASFSRETELVSTSTFHKGKGSIGFQCYIPEANIIEYK